MTISNYLIEFSVFITVVYAGYRVILSNHKLLHFNRVYLLIGLLLSVVIPFLNFSVSSSGAYAGMVKVLPAIVINSGNTAQISQAAASRSGLAIGEIMLLVFYFAGLGATLFKSIQNLKHIKKIINQSYKTKKYGTVIHVSKNCDSAFNFFHTIVVPEKNLENKQLKHLLTHEYVHRQQWHTADKMLMELIHIVFWFHPVVWLYGKAVSQNHEFLADQGVIKTGNSSQLYLKFLAGFVYSKQLSPSSQFNQSLTLKRLAMIQKTSKTNVAYFKITLLLAALITTGIFQACETGETDNKGQTEVNTETVADAKKSDNSIAVKMITPDDQELATEIANIDELAIVLSQNGAIKSISINNESTEAYNSVEKMPEFPGGEQALAKFLSQTVKYPETALESSIEGKVFVQFIVNAEGYVKYAEVVRGVNSELDKEALRAVFMMPKWTPGEQNGKKVATKFTVPINFKLS